MVLQDFNLWERHVKQLRLKGTRDAEALDLEILEEDSMRLKLTRMLTRIDLTLDAWMEPRK